MIKYIKYSIFWTILMSAILTSCKDPSKDDSGQNSGDQAAPVIPKPTPQQPNRPVGAKPTPEPAKAKLDPKEFVKYDGSSAEKFIPQLFPPDCPLDNDKVTFLTFFFTGRGGDKEDVEERLKRMIQNPEVINTPYFIAISFHHKSNNAEVGEDYINRTISNKTEREAILAQKKNISMKMEYTMGYDQKGEYGYQLPNLRNDAAKIKKICDKIREFQGQNKEEFRKNFLDSLDI